MKHSVRNKKKKKAKRQGLRNRGGLVNNEDRISHLPEALILDILSLLPTKDVVATSVLSKQWRCRWKMVHVLDLDDESIQSEHRTFAEIVSRVLHSHEAPLLERFRIKCYVRRRDSHTMDVRLWIATASARHLRELDLGVASHTEGYFRLPESLYSCKTLETLELSSSVIVDVPSEACLKSLRTLHLSYVHHEDEASFGNLLSACPKLEDLSVYRHSTLSVPPTLTIAVPSLQRLTVSDNNIWLGAGGYVIDAPSVKYLKIKICDALTFLINKATELVEAKIIRVSNLNNDNILGSLTSAKRLCLSLSPSPSDITLAMGSIFYQLLCLELLTYKAEWWNLLVLMLDRSPKLQVLKLDARYCYENRGRVAWSQPKNVAECLLFHLETFVWECYKKHLEEQKAVAEYILRNACRLKRATVSIQGLHSDERIDLLEELQSVVRASTSSCQLLMLDSKLSDE